MLTVIPVDQKLFRQETMGKIIVMGYKNVSDLPGSATAGWQNQPDFDKKEGSERKGGRDLP